MYKESKNKTNSYAQMPLYFNPMWRFKSNFPETARSRKKLYTYTIKVSGITKIPAITRNDKPGNVDTVDL